MGAQLRAPYPVVIRWR